jgi:hypothetical protein
LGENSPNLVTLLRTTFRVIFTQLQEDLLPHRQSAAKAAQLFISL